MHCSWKDCIVQDRPHRDGQYWYSLLGGNHQYGHDALRVAPPGLVPRIQGAMGSTNRGMPESHGPQSLCPLHSPPLPSTSLPSTPRLSTPVHSPHVHSTALPFSSSARESSCPLHRTPLHSPPLPSTIGLRVACASRMSRSGRKDPVNRCAANPPTPWGSSFPLPKRLPRKPDPVNLEGRGES